MVATWMKSSRGYLLTKEGSASSCSLCLSLNRGRAYTSQSKDGYKTQTTLHICFMLKLYTILDGRKSLLHVEAIYNCRWQKILVTSSAYYPSSIKNFFFLEFCILSKPHRLALEFNQAWFPICEPAPAIFSVNCNFCSATTIYTT